MTKPIKYSTTGITKIKLVLDSENIEYEQEKVIIKGRKFRADFYLPKYNCVIEYEGINSKKSGHLTFDGYTKNCEKYNLLSLNGYKLLRYTMKNLTQLSNDLNTLRNEKAKS